jgi:hypothetical protein
MLNVYKKAIYDELGYEISKQLKEANCKFVVNYKDLTYTFLDCPEHLLKQILEVKKKKGINSILNEFIF